MTSKWPTSVFAQNTNINLQAKDVAALFVNVTNYWYNDPKNGLFCKKFQVYDLILNYLTTGCEPENMTHEFIYVLNKFKMEWFEFGEPS